MWKLPEVIRLGQKCWPHPPTHHPDREGERPASVVPWSPIRGLLRGFLGLRSLVQPPRTPKALSKAHTLNHDKNRYLAEGLFLHQGLLEAQEQSYYSQRLQRSPTQNLEGPPKPQNPVFSRGSRHLSIEGLDPEVIYMYIHLFVHFVPFVCITSLYRKYVPKVHHKYENYGLIP